MAGLTSALYLLRPAGRSVQIADRGATPRSVEISQDQEPPKRDNGPTKLNWVAPTDTPQRVAPRRVESRPPQPPAAVAEIPNDPVWLAWRAISTVLAAGALRGGEVVGEPEQTVAVVVAWDDVLPEEAWNVPETSSYSVAVTMPNGDRNTLATETHPADPEAPIMVAASYQSRL